MIHVVEVEHYTRLDSAEEKNNLSFAQKKTQLGIYVCSQKIIFVKHCVLRCMHSDIVIVRALYSEMRRPVTINRNL